MSSLIVLALRQAFSANQKLTVSARLAGWQAPRGCPIPNARVIGSCGHAPLFTWVLGIQTQLLILTEPSPSPPRQPFKCKGTHLCTWTVIPPLPVHLFPQCSLYETQYLGQDSWQAARHGCVISPLSSAR